MRRTARVTCLVAGLLVLTSCDVGAPARVQAPVDSAAGEVAFELAGPGGAALVVPVFINGQGPFDFVLDTGATFTCVDDALAERLGLQEQRGQVAIGAGVGGAGRVRLVRMDSLRIGEARVERMTACVLDLQALRSIGTGVHGLVGLNFLKSFRVTLDFQRNVVGLQTP
jgi:clan AA aspartic protease (TIGR02281 family)